ncbi:ThuA domain-containing protein [Horticoccus luteus]|uniref:ThuA domain-containing protein n=1 Tax=Horticoccus luteus TaxID=2862869 RepID=A0A8F9TYL0_9BACT|nr:ThuA domain-containing protein [Horticoccus luteus]QYM80382.1 ThuA domain-containing protein [Horticoccus luteus]
MKKALIFQGGWDGHQPRQCADLFATKLTERGFAVEVADSLTVLNDAERLRELSLIVPLWTCGTLTAEQETNLVAAVEKGGVGLGGFHGGMGDAFRGAISYQWMVGGQFLAHPDNVKDYTINIVRPDDPITRGIPDFKVRSEQYYMLVDPRNEVLATTTHQSVSATWTNGVVMPFVWKKPHGAGRVFYAAMGHQLAEFHDHPEQLEITLRGMVWAAR